MLTSCSCGLPAVAGGVLVLGSEPTPRWGRRSGLAGWRQRVGLVGAVVMVWSRPCRGPDAVVTFVGNTKAADPESGSAA
ncbi:MAG: hypothetical protein V9G08_15125 [Dermatophilaceae bacterium]